MKKIVMLAAIGLLLSAGSSLAQDRRYHQNHGRTYNPQPPSHSHHHRHNGWLGPAIIGGGLGLGLGYGLYQYNRPPPAYYEPPVYVYPEVKVWDSYCGCYRIVPN